MRLISLLASMTMAACTAAVPQTADDAPPAALWTYAALVDDLRQQSCPEGTLYKRAEALSVQVIDAGRGGQKAREKNLTGMTLAGSWHLKSDNSEFGGLSGLAVLKSGSLLSVTDDGKFIWIGIDPETGAPDGIGSIAYLRDEEGDIFPNKRAADAEDLAYRDGLAFVSFEQEHRISAYDLESCGVAARAAVVAKLNKVVGGNVLENNRGGEALTFDGDTLKVGFEARNRDGSPVGTVRLDGSLANVRRTGQPSLYLLTSMDAADGVTASVFRAYDPVRGSRAIVTVEGENNLSAKADLKSPLPVDNFEGIAIGTSPDGATRIWLISDDNFSNNQRTLLLAFDLDQ